MKSHNFIHQRTADTKYIIIYMTEKKYKNINRCKVCLTTKPLDNAYDSLCETESFGVRG